MNQIALFDGASSAGTEVLTMTSREIAELTGKRHDNVMVDCRKLVEFYAETYSPEKSGEFVKSSTYNDSTGRALPCYKLNKMASLDLVTGYSLPHRHAVNKRWQELEAQVAAPTPSVAQDPEVARLVAMRDSGLMSQTVCEIAAFRLLGLIHPSEDRVNDQAPEVPEVQPDASSDSQEATPYFLRIEYEQTRRGRRVKFRPKFAGTPTPLRLNANGRVLVNAGDEVGMNALGVAAYVVGGYVEVRRALYEFDIDTITGEVTVNGARFSAGGRLRGMQCWKAVKLLRHLSGMD